MLSDYISKGRHIKLGEKSWALKNKWKKQGHNWSATISQQLFHSNCNRNNIIKFIWNSAIEKFLCLSSPCCPQWHLYLVEAACLRLPWYKLIKKFYRQDLIHSSFIIIDQSLNLNEYISCWTFPIRSMQRNIYNPHK